MRISWISVNDFSQGLGHGIEFLYGDLRSYSHPIIAFLEGYKWFHEDVKVVTVKILKSSSSSLKKYPEEGDVVIQRVKEAIRLFLSDKRLQKHGEITPDVFAWFNS